MVDDAHSGFSNEYRVAFVAQISDLAKLRIFAAGVALQTLFSPPGTDGGIAGGVLLPVGVALVSTVGINAPRLAFMPSGVALQTGIVPSVVGGGGGGAVGMVGLPAGVALACLVAFNAPLAPQLPTGVALLTKVSSPAPDKTDVPVGVALVTTVSSSGGGSAVSPGSTCAAAGAITRPYSASGYALAASADNYFSFSVVSGSGYSVTVTPTSGSIGGTSVFGGSCGFRSPSYGTTGTSGGTVSFMATASGTVWIQVFGGAGSAVYSLAVS